LDVDFQAAGELRLTGLSSAHQIDVDGYRVAPDRDGRLFLAPGKHVVMASRPGFLPRDSEVLLDPRAHVTVNVGLVPATGFLTILRPPPDSAIQLSGGLVVPTKESKSLPLTRLQLPVGQYNALVESRGDDAWSGTLNIEAEKETRIDMVQTIYEHDLGAWKAELWLTALGALGLVALGKSEADQVDSFNSKYGNPDDLTISEYREFDSKKESAQEHKTYSDLAYGAAAIMAGLFLWLALDPPDPPPREQAFRIVPAVEIDRTALAFEVKW
jgi:hypothetical protein